MKFKDIIKYPYVVSATAAIAAFIIGKNVNADVDPLAGVGKSVPVQSWTPDPKGIYCDPAKGPYRFQKNCLPEYLESFKVDPSVCAPGKTRGPDLSDKCHPKNIN